MTREREFVLAKIREAISQGKPPSLLQIDRDYVQKHGPAGRSVLFMAIKQLNLENQITQDGDLLRPGDEFRI